MPDREKVIKELETEIQDFSPACTSDERLKEIMEMALELLKGQEPDVSKYQYKIDHTDCLWYSDTPVTTVMRCYKCGCCNADITAGNPYC